MDAPPGAKKGPPGRIVRDLDFLKVLRTFAIGRTLRALSFFFFLTEHALWQVYKRFKMIQNNVVIVGLTISMHF